MNKVIFLAISFAISNGLANAGTKETRVGSTTFVGSELRVAERFTREIQNTDPITYIYTGNGSGSLGGATFVDKDFIITASSDKGNINQWQNADWQNTHLETTINIDGLGLFTITTHSHTWIAEGCCGGIGENLASNWVDINEGAFTNVGYALDTALGPVTDFSPSSTNQFTGVETTGGELNFSYITTLTFTAKIAQDKPQISIDGGFVKLDTTSGLIPASDECLSFDHYGRQIYDEVNGILYICARSGWLQH